MDQVTQVREKIDIVSLISEYLPVKKMGRNFKTNCPFHNEKTPSFVISPERQIWHCFGCQKGGDAFAFLMEYESLEFPEALRILAKKAGIEIKQTQVQMGAASKKEKIYALNSLALEFYHYLLTKHNIGKKALDYLTEKRKIRQAVVNTFMLGFSPNAGDALVNYLITKKKYKKEDLIEAGLAKFWGRDLVDFFKGRLMFPLFDHRGNVVGFSGRLLTDANESKYINTRETFVYQKTNHFFGINIAKDEIKKEQRAIIVEGEFDVISSFQEGIKNVIAVKGSALTENQVNLLSRFTKKISLCFDMDKAGQDAVKRSLQVLEKKGFTTTVILTPDGKDPDEAIKNDPISFKKALKEELGIYDYLLGKTISSFDKKTIDGKRKISDEVLPFFVGIENEIVKEFYLKKLSRELDISFESVLRELEKIKNKEIVKKDIKQIQKQKKEREDILEEYFLALIVQFDKPNLIFEKIPDFFQAYAFRTPSYKKILDKLILYIKGKDSFDVAAFSKILPEELVSSFDTCFLLPVAKFENDKKYLEELEKTARELRILELKSKIKDLSEKIKLKEKQGEEIELESLREEFSSALLSLNKL